jgi:hypothetical protein
VKLHPVATGTILLLSVLLIATAIAGGAWAWIVGPVPGKRFSDTIDIANFLVGCATILSAGATLLVVYIINYLYIVQSSTAKGDSELLLEVLRDVRRSASSLRELSIPCYSGKKLTNQEQQKLLIAQRELANSVHSFVDALGHCGIKAASLSTSKLSEFRSELKDSLTDSPYPGPYDQAAQNRIHMAFKQFQDELTRLFFSVIHR